MELNLCNTGVEPIVIEYCDIDILLNPNETRTISCNTSAECYIKIYHINNNKFNTLWYILNEIFTLEQMRTVLVVDGEYKISCACDNPTIKIKSQEYVFERNTSYQTFIFSSNSCSVTKVDLKVANELAISKKAKILYLFGGYKTLFPLTGIATVTSLIKIALYGAPPWFAILTIGLAICFALCFLKYIYALKRLTAAMNSENILKYLSSQRREFRKFTDELAQQYLNVNAGDDVYS